ncbi:DUF72 domain-containing protein [Blastococcus tunisiensis]|uniref:DUF72 domain-containing protein n=1 Tax=Blastococcus tunisiensis TaxID=1798228 RepID=UPI001C3137DD
MRHYTQFFPTVESYNAFYRLPERETSEKWRERIPPEFRWLCQGRPVPHPHTARRESHGSRWAG